MAKYWVRPSEVEAEQFTESHVPFGSEESRMTGTTSVLEVLTSTGRKLVFHGDWVVKHSAGNLSVWTDKQFNEYYMLDATACLSCGQTDKGQTGEYCCSLCELPTLHDGPVKS